MSGTTYLELVVAAVGMFACGFSAYSLWQSWLDRLALRRSGRNGIRRLVSDGHIARSASRFNMSALLAAGAIWSLYLPDDRTPVTLVLKHALMFIGWVLLFECVMDWRLRRAVEAFMDESGL